MAVAAGLSRVPRDTLRNIFRSILKEEKMSALICGSFAYDHIMSFPERFADHILPNRVHILNVCFLVPEMRREFGGCAGNIAYALNMLQPDVAVPMGAVGRDFAPYGEWLQKHGIPRRHILEIEQTHTAQAFIVTDRDDNQITAFHPGAMDHAHRNRVGDCPRARIGVVAPDGRQGMVEHARQFSEAGIPFLFDPGQGTPMFSREELLAFLEQAQWVSVNEYEWALLRERSGLDAGELARRVQAAIVTRGREGSVIYTREEEFRIPPAPVETEADPTGCGDAYRAGLLYGLLHEMGWETAGRMASLLGAVQVGCRGTQNLDFAPDEIADRFREGFGYRL